MNLTEFLQAILLAIPILVIVVAFVLGIAGLQAFLARRIRAQWRAEGRHIKFGPVATSLYRLNQIGEDTNNPDLGVVGIVDDQLVARSLFGKRYHFAVPLADIHHIGLQQVLRNDDSAQQKYRVQVDFDAPGGWQACRFALKAWREFADTLVAETSLPLPERRYDLIPTTATRLKQDIHGQWHADFIDKLYLAPDRLLFAWRETIMLDTIQAITLYDQQSLLDKLGTLNPLDRDLLRLDYLDAAGQPQMIGFRLIGARQWAEHIAEYTGIAFTIMGERKKKDTAD